MGIERLDGFMTTEKQRGFETDFRLETETYEVWDEIEVGRVATAKQTFVVKEQDILSYNFPALEDDPLFVDPQAARAAPASTKSSPIPCSRCRSPSIASKRAQATGCAHRVPAIRARSSFSMNLSGSAMRSR